MNPQPGSRWSDERLDDFMRRYRDDQERAHNEHEDTRERLEELAQATEKRANEIVAEMRVGFMRIAEDAQRQRDLARDSEVQRKRDLRTQTVALLVALIAAAATIGAAMIASAP